jgi:hypothetical protein
VADRHVYLPHAIFAGALAVLLARCISKASAVARRNLLAGGAGLLLGVAWLGHAQASIWRNTGTLFSYIERQPAFVWDARQQAHIHSIWAAYEQSRARPEEATFHLKRAHRVLVDRLLAALQAGETDVFLECAADLEGRFGLPPQLRRERARILLKQGAREAALRDLEIVVRALPEDLESQQLWQTARKAP